MLHGRDLKKVLLFSLYGLSMVWSPVFGTSEAIVFPSLFAFPDYLLGSRLLNLLALALFMLVAALWGDTLRRLLHRGPFVPCAVIVGTLGMFLGDAAGLGWLPPEALLAGAAARGLFGGMTAMLWIGLFIHLDRRLIGAAVAAALTLYALFGIGVTCLGSIAPVAAAALLALCPILSCAGSLPLRDSPIRSQPVDQEETTAPLKTRCMFYAANFAFGIMLGGLLAYFSIADSLLYVLVFLAMATMLLVAFAILEEKADLRATFRSFMLCYTVAVSLLVLLGLLSQPVALGLASAALAAILLYTIVIFLDTQARFRKPYWRIPGFTQVFSSIGMMTSFVLFHTTFPGATINGIGPLLLAAACLIFIASVFLSEGGFSSRPWGFSSLIPVESREIRRVRRCGNLADTHHLTTRELEILQLLASGSTRENVAEVLIISPATAKTHVRNIYAKLGIHSQRELEELLDG